MWIVRVALDRPYTFIVLAVLILVLSPVMILRTPTDIFPNIDIPVIAVAWQFTGMNPEELEGRLTSTYERVLTTTADNIEHLESTTVNGQAIVKIYLQQGASLDTANAQVTAVSQTILRQLPPGTLPPLIINYSASSVPILQLGLSGSGLSEQQLNDVGQNFLRPQLVTVPGAVIPFLYGGKQRQVMVDLNPGLVQSKGLSPQDVLNAVQQQNFILPSGTAKMGPFEYDVRLNTSTRTVPELNDLPIKVVGNSTVHLRPRFHQRRDPRGRDRRVPHRVDDSALPGKLAQYLDHCRLHSAIHPDVRHDPQLSRRNHQHHDARGLGPRRRNSCGRRYGYDRKHRAVLRRRTRQARRHSGRRGANRRSRPGVHALHLHRVLAHVLFERRSPISLRASCRSCGVRHACVLHPFADARTYAGDVFVESKTGRARRLTESTGAVPASVRARIRTPSEGLSHPTHRSCPPSRPFRPRVSSDLHRGISPCAVARSGLLSDQRQRSIHPPSPRQERDADRRDREVVRPRRGHNTPRDP